jgi:hypothetical protein
MDLIIQLQQQHVEILHFFESIKSEMIKSNTQDNYLKEELSNLRDFLMGHLALEDKMLYPALEKSKSKEAREIGKKFSVEMLGISKVAMAFFEKYSALQLSDLLKNVKFKNEANMIIIAVKKRVGVEETILYPTYKKYCEK